MDQGGGAGSSGEKSEAIKGPRDGGASHGPGATAALYPCGGLAAEHTESTVHPGTQIPSKCASQNYNISLIKIHFLYYFVTLFKIIDCPITLINPQKTYPLDG